jgi:5'-nucleotidase
MPRILVTNDDGIYSEGLRKLAAVLAPLGEITIVAPDREQSAASHALTLNRPLRMLKLEENEWIVDGTPTDCVNLAVLKVMRDARPDIVVSGINFGPNLGDDVTYSGTVAAALEGVMLGLPAIAVSAQQIDPGDDQWDGRAYDFRAVAGFVARLVPAVLHPDFPPRVVLSVNAPGLPPEAVRGARVTRLGRRVYDDRLTLEHTEGTRRRYAIYGGTASWEREEGTDFAAIEEGAMSVTPLHFDLTDMDGMDHLERLSLTDLLHADPVMEG